MFIPPPAPSTTDAQTTAAIEKAYNEVDVATLYWLQIQPLSEYNRTYVTHAINSPRVVDNIEIKTAISKKDKPTLEQYRAKADLHPVNLRLVNDGLGILATGEKEAQIAEQNRLDKITLDDAFGAKDLATVESLINRKDPPLSSDNMKLALQIKEYLMENSATNLNQGELDAAGIQAAIANNDIATLYWFRDTKTPAISEENKKKINDYFAFQQQEEERKKKEAETQPPPADPFGLTLSQYDLDMAEYQKHLADNNLKGLKELRNRVDPPVDPAIIKLLDEAIAAIEAKYAEMGVPPEPEISTITSGVAPPAQAAQAPFRGAVEGFGVGGMMSRAAAARKIPPKEEEIITIKGQTVPPPPGSQGLLTDEGWTMLKNLAFNVVKYTGLYVAPAVLAGIVYQYSANQPDGTLLRSIADIIPKPKFRQEDAEAFMSQAGKVTRLFGEVLPDVVRGTTPGKPGGLMLADEGPLPEPRKMWYETKDVVQNFQKIASWNEKDRQLVNDVFPKAPSVLSGSRRGSTMSLDNFPIVEYRNKEVANYASGSNASVTSDLITAALRQLNSKVTPKPTKAIPFSKAASMVMGLATGPPQDTSMVAAIAKRAAENLIAGSTKKPKRSSTLTGTGKKQKK